MTGLGLGESEADDSLMMDDMCLKSQPALGLNDNKRGSSHIFSFKRTISKPYLNRQANDEEINNSSALF